MPEYVKIRGHGLGQLPKMQELKDIFFQKLLQDNS